MADKSEKKRRWRPSPFRWALISIPLCAVVGTVAGGLLGQAAIGIAIGAAVGFGLAAALFAAGIVFALLNES